MGRGPIAVKFLGSGDCYNYAPSHISHPFVVRLDNKIHFAYIACWLQIKNMHVIELKFPKTNTQKFRQDVVGYVG